jgi:hypothetical protein
MVFLWKSIHWMFCGGFFIVPTENIDPFLMVHMEALEQYASRDGPSVGNASHRSGRSRASAASGASRKSRAAGRADPLPDGDFVDRGPN